MNFGDKLRGLLPRTLKYTCYFTMIITLPVVAYAYQKGVVEPDFSLIAELWWVPLCASLLIFKALLIQALLEYANGSDDVVTRKQKA